MNKEERQKYIEEYQIREIKRSEAKRKLKLIELVLILLVVIVTTIYITVRRTMYTTIMADINNDGYYETITIPKWKTDEYPNRIE